MIHSNKATINQLESPAFISQANAYYKTALGGVNRKNIFTNEILYNIISMSIEKYLMGFLMSRNQLATGHTLTTMILDVKKYITVPESLEKRMDYFDRLQFICTFAFFKQEPITDKDIVDMIQVLKEIRELVQPNLFTVTIAD